MLETIRPLVPPARLEHPLPDLVDDYTKLFAVRPTSKAAETTTHNRIIAALTDLEPGQAVVYAIAPNLAGCWRAPIAYQAYKAGIVDLVQLKLLGGVYAYLAVRRRNTQRPQ
jgi:hypothetical protein